MRKAFLLINVLLLFLITSTGFSQATKVYNHPNFEKIVEFEAPAGWIDFVHSNDRNAYEVKHPDGDIHVLVWVTETCQDGPRYLAKMCDMNSMNYESESSKRNINGREVWSSYTIGKKGNLPVKELIALVQTDHSVLPEHHRHYIIRIWCSYEKFDIYKDLMEKILSSLKIYNP